MAFAGAKHLLLAMTNDKYLFAPTVSQKVTKVTAFTSFQF